MRVKVLAQFNDGWVKRIRRPGEIFETTREKYEYFNSASLVVSVKDETPYFERMTKKELVEYAKQQGIELDTSLTKKAMLEELS